MAPSRTSNTVSRTITVNFIFKDETKGAYRYQEVNGQGLPVKTQDGLIGTLYMRKDKLPNATARIQVTVDLNPS